MTARLVAALALASLALLLEGGASATPPVAPVAAASARGLAVEIVAPDQTVTAATSEATAPPSATQPPSSFAYPEDGSIVSLASTSVTVSASAADGTAAVVSDATGLSLFGGEITADDVHGSVSSAGTIGDLSGSTVTNLMVLGTSIPAPPNTRIPVGDWGSAVLLGQSTQAGTGSPPSWRGTVTALVIHLDADHGGLPAGSEIRIGFADAYARTPAAAPKATSRKARPRAAPARRPTRPARPGRFKNVGGDRATDPHRLRQTPNAPGPILLAPPNVTPKLTAGGYVFPVYGPSGYGDTFGAPRGDVSGGWHHGDDLFAPLGAPILAVAEGTVFSVGWNDVGGYRLWLRDKAGNEFYYAHLAAYTSLAVNGRHVKAGDVLGFVGNTGDAATTPFHLHFEVHPVALLFLGYDGAVNPTSYLDAWKRLEDIRILPAVLFASPAAEASGAPPAGAMLLQSSDISTANGLDPDSLIRAMNAPTLNVAVPHVAQLPVPLPVLDRA
jgi:murein DD-endopeptidase MepM/ murein hydrolase activator NlpD